MKKGDRVPRPPVGDDWDIVFANNPATKGWVELCAKATANCAKLHDLLRTDPRNRDAPHRHHRLKGELSVVNIKGRQVEQWQHEVTGASRVWFGIDDANRTIYVTLAEVGHPKKTDR